MCKEIIWVGGYPRVPGINMPNEKPQPETEEGVFEPRDNQLRDKTGGMPEQLGSRVRPSPQTEVV